LSKFIHLIVLQHYTVGQMYMAVFVGSYMKHIKTLQNFAFYHFTIIFC